MTKRSEDTMEDRFYRITGIAEAAFVVAECLQLGEGEPGTAPGKAILPLVVTLQKEIEELQRHYLKVSGGVGAA